MFLLDKKLFSRAAKWQRSTCMTSHIRVPWVIIFLLLKSVFSNFSGALSLQLRNPRVLISLVVQWLRIHLQCWGHGFNSYYREDSTFCEPQLLKPMFPGAHALQLESSPHSPQLEKACACNKDPVQTKINK